MTASSVRRARATILALALALAVFAVGALWTALLAKRPRPTRRAGACARDVVARATIVTSALVGAVLKHGSTIIKNSVGRDTGMLEYKIRRFTASRVRGQ